ncbi:hypothetical protein DIPPA_14922 [Diplonema papillatum]|nr:hypothetical protein DIPPA_14922 [Diplonema papillatum]
MSGAEVDVLREEVKRLKGVEKAAVRYAAEAEAAKRREAEVYGDAECRIRHLLDSELQLMRSLAEVKEEVARRGLQVAALERDAREKADEADGPAAADLQQLCAEKDDAIEALRREVLRQSDTITALETTYNNRQQPGDDEAAAHLQRLCGEKDEAIAALEEALRNAVRAGFSSSRSASSKALQRDAREQAGKLINLDPNNNNDQAADSDAEQQAVARLEELCSEKDEAIAALEEALHNAVRAGFASSRSTSGRALQRQAREQAGRLIDFEDRDPDADDDPAQENAARLERLCSEKDEAIAALENALRNSAGQQQQQQAARDVHDPRVSELTDRLQTEQGKVSGLQQLTAELAEKVRVLSMQRTAVSAAGSESADRRVASVVDKVAGLEQALVVSAGETARLNDLLEKGYLSPQRTRDSPQQQPRGPLAGGDAPADFFAGFEQDPLGATPRPTVSEIFQELWTGMAGAAADPASPPRAMMTEFREAEGLASTEDGLRVSSQELLLRNKRELTGLLLRLCLAAKRMPQAGGAAADKPPLIGSPPALPSTLLTMPRDQLARTVQKIWAATLRGKPPHCTAAARAQAVHRLRGVQRRYPELLCDVDDGSGSPDPVGFPATEAGALRLKLAGRVALLEVYADLTHADAPPAGTVTAGYPTFSALFCETWDAVASVVRRSGSPGGGVAGEVRRRMVEFQAEFLAPLGRPEGGIDRAQVSVVGYTAAELAAWYARLRELATAAWAAAPKEVPAPLAHPPTPLPAQGSRRAQHANSRADLTHAIHALWQLCVADLASPRARPLARQLVGFQRRHGVDQATLLSEGPVRSLCETDLLIKDAAELEAMLQELAGIAPKRAVDELSSGFAGERPPQTPDHRFASRAELAQSAQDLWATARQFAEREPAGRRPPLAHRLADFLRQRFSVAAAPAALPGRLPEVAVMLKNKSELADVFEHLSSICPEARLAFDEAREDAGRWQSCLPLNGAELFSKSKPELIDLALQYYTEVTRSGDGAELTGLYRTLADVSPMVRAGPNHARQASNPVLGFMEGNPPFNAAALSSRTRSELVELVQYLAGRAAHRAGSQGHRRGYGNGCDLDTWNQPHHTAGSCWGSHPAELASQGDLAERYMVRSREELAHQIWSLYADVKRAKAGLGRVEACAAVKALYKGNPARRELARAADAVQAAKGKARWLVANYLTDVEKLHLGVPSHVFPPDDVVVRHFGLEPTRELDWELKQSGGYDYVQRNLKELVAGAKRRSAKALRGDARSLSPNEPRYPAKAARFQSRSRSAVEREWGDPPPQPASDVYSCSASRSSASPTDLAPGTVFPHIEGGRQRPRSPAPQPPADVIALHTTLPQGAGGRVPAYPSGLKAEAKPSNPGNNAADSRRSSASFSKASAERPAAQNLSKPALDAVSSIHDDTPRSAASSIRSHSSANDDEVPPIPTHVAGMKAASARSRTASNVSRDPSQCSFSLPNQLSTTPQPPSHSPDVQAVPPSQRVSTHPSPGPTPTLSHDSHPSFVTPAHRHVDGSSVHSRTPGASLSELDLPGRAADGAVNRKSTVSTPWDSALNPSDPTTPSNQTAVHGANAARSPSPSLQSAA